MNKKHLGPEVSDASEVLHLKLWEGSVFDYSLTGNVCTATATTTGNGGLEFNGTTSIVNCGSGASVDDIFVGGGTLAWWQRSDGRGEGNLGRVFDKTQWLVYMFGDTTTMRLLQTFSVGTGVWSLTIVSGIWQHIAIVYNNDASTNNPMVYVNGASVTATENATPGSELDTSDAASTLYVGNTSDASRTWDGAISDVRMYDNERTASHMRDLYNQTRWRYGV